LTVLAAGGLLLLASLYLPWLEASQPHGDDLLNLFTHLGTVDGFGSRVGDAAAVSDLLLLGTVLLFILRPRLAHRLPLGRSALLAFYLAVAVGVQARAVADTDELAQRGLHYHFAYGAYLGFAAAAVVLLAAVAAWEQPVAGPRGAVLLGALASTGTVALLVAFLLPWGSYSLFPVTFHGITTPAAVAAAAVAPWLLACWWSGRDAPSLVAAAASLAVLAGGAFSSLASPASHSYGAWLGLSLAVAVLALTVAEAAPRVRLPGPSPFDLATAAAAALLVASMFLPWQEYCYPASREFRSLSGRCFSSDGWSVLGAVAAGLALVAIFVRISRRLLASRLELAAAIAVLVATAGFELVDSRQGGIRLESGYGSTVCFAAAAALAALALVRLRPRRVDRSDAVRVLPVATCSAYLVVVVLPWWDVLPSGTDEALRYAPPSWLTIAGVVVAIRLLRSWTEGSAFRSELIVLLPLALVALAGVQLVALRDDGMTWGRGLVVGLSVMLVLFGWVERRRGLETLPAALRVDRL
jgi:hypothetical protein